MNNSRRGAGTHDRRNTRCARAATLGASPTRFVLWLAFTGRYYVSSSVFLVAETGLENNFVSRFSPIFRIFSNFHLEMEKFIFGRLYGLVSFFLNLDLNFVLFLG